MPSINTRTPGANGASRDREAAKAQQERKVQGEEAAERAQARRKQVSQAEERAQVARQERGAAAGTILDVWA